MLNQIEKHGTMVKPWAIVVNEKGKLYGIRLSGLASVLLTLAKINTYLLPAHLWFARVQC